MTQQGQHKYMLILAHCSEAAARNAAYFFLFSTLLNPEASA